MKKRKFSLLLNVATICLCVCAIAIGVYSAKNARLSINGSIGFEAHNCKVRVLGRIDGAVDAQNKPITENDENFQPIFADGSSGKVIDGSETWTIGDLFFDDLNCESGQIATPIKFTFTMENMSEYLIVASLKIPNDMYKVMDVSAPTVSTDIENYLDGESYSGYAFSLPSGATSGSAGDAVTVTITLLPLSDEGFKEDVSLSGMQMYFEKPKALSNPISIPLDDVEGIESITTYKYDDNFSIIDDFTCYYAMGALDESTVLTHVAAVYLANINSVSGELKYPTVVSKYNTDTNNDELLWLIPSCDIIEMNNSSDLPVYSNITSVQLPSGATRVFVGAFLNFQDLESICLPKTIKYIDFEAFTYCAKLSSIVIPNTVVEIGHLAFLGCSMLNEVIFEENSKLASIGFNAFQYCTGLQNITIPKSMTEIKADTFYGCTTLDSVTIPKVVTTIGDYAFINCTSLTSITFEGTQAEWEAISFGEYWNKNTGAYTITCSDGVISKS